MKWIWTAQEHPNQYVEFAEEFAAESVGTGVTYRLRISADTEYVVWVNGRFVGNGQYGDFPYYKVYDEIDISGFVKEGNNRLAILAWHMGMDTLMHYKKKAGLWFEVLDGEGAVLAQSGTETLSRQSRAYRQDVSYKITSQLGYAWAYDFNQEDDWKVGASAGPEFVETENRMKADGFGCSVEWEDEARLYPRPIKKCKTERFTKGRVCAQGIYKSNSTENLNPAQFAQSAWLQAKHFEEMTGLVKKNTPDWTEPIPFKKNGTIQKDADFAGNSDNGIYVVVDLKEECAGYPILELEVEKSCKMYLAYGEHLADLRVRAEIGGRNFGFEISLKEGRNRLEEYTHRIAGRYLMLFVETDEFVLHTAGILNVEYPFVVKERHFNDRLVQKIYDVGVRTLKLCAHEHHEDCPWREQALYGMDSRNQMLFGYSVFEEYEFPRASLRLLAYSQRKDGLLAICAPSGVNLTIPSFSLYWLLAVCENADVNYQADFVAEMLPYAERLRECYAKQLTEQGIRSFQGASMWNFHEWVDGLSGKELPTDRTTELVSTALFYLVMKKMARLEERQGNKNQQKRCEELANEAKAAAEAFYCPDTGLYASYISDGKQTGLHGYTLSLLICSGMIPGEREITLARALKGASGVLPLPVENTFATLPWKYEALLETGVCSVEDIIDEICETFGGILFEGATSLPETRFGEVDFSEAGSLCHAWSAVPCYIFNKYLKNQ